MLDKADEQDKENEGKLKKLKEENDKKSSFSKVWPYNSPKILVIPALLGSLIKGCGSPV